MAEEVESHTIRLLQELRDTLCSMNKRFDGMNDRFVAMEDRFTDLTQRIDGNTLVFNLVAGVVHDHEDRQAGGRSSVIVA